MPKFSLQSDAVFVPARERSRIAQLIWLLQHAVAGLAVGANGLPGYVKWVLAMVVVGSLWCTRPRRSSMLIVATDGSWSLPDESLTRMQLLPGSRFTRFWARLAFGDADGSRYVRQIWYDVFSGEDRRRLQIVLRERSRAAR